MEVNNGLNTRKNERKILQNCKGSERVAQAVVALRSVFVVSDFSDAVKVNSESNLLTATQIVFQEIIQILRDIKIIISYLNVLYVAV